MNVYGKRAQENWRRLAPAAYAQIPDPNSHFSMLGQTAEQQVMDLTTSLTGPDLPGEEFWHKVGRLTAAKRAAEEIVWADLLTPPAAEWAPDQDPELEGMAEADVETVRQAEIDRELNAQWSARSYETISLLQQRGVPESTIQDLVTADVLGAPDAMTHLASLGLV